VGGSTTEAKPSGTPSTSRETNQINPERTHRIGSSIGKENPAAPAVGKQPSVSVTERQTSVSAGSRTVSDKASRIGSSDSDKKPSTSPTATQPVISPNKTSRIGSPIGKEKGGQENGKSAPGRSRGTSELVSGEKTGPANSLVGTEQPSVSSIGSQGDAGRGGNRTDSQRTSRTGESAADKKLPVLNTVKGSQRGVHKVDTPEKIQQTQDARLKTQDPRPDPGHKDGATVNSRLRERISENQKTIINNTVPHFDGDKTRVRRDERIGSSHVVYDDCPEMVWHSRHHEHIYFDHHRQVCHRAIWPEYYFPVYYNWGPCWTFRYVYPYYHRKYVFVSLGGYWPVDYTYVRYYWYGCHPYIWSGYYPIPYEVEGNTYNYYTYNYPSTEAGTTASAGPVETTNYIRPVDENTFADVREKLAKQQAAKPDRETPADAYFEEATKAFEIYDYDTAIEKFARAIEFAPDDMILPFAYAQALLADERYVEAAGVLRAALAKVSPEKEGVFYPRGLYTNDDVLFEQIDRLDEKAKLYSFDADLQLLLGYQLLGIGEIDQAIEPLHLASQDLENAAAAAVLLNVLEKVRASSTSQNID
jgi:hypothetical protein